MPSPEVEVGGLGEFKAMTANGRAGEAMIARKLDREQRYMKLTKREEEDSIGDWLFGTGGIRGLSLRRENPLALMDIPVPTDGSRKAHHGPSRLEAAMEKYNKMSAEAQKRAELNKPKARAAPPPRVRASLAKLTLKERVVLTAKSTWKACFRCFGVCCNGPEDSDQKRLDGAPINLSGIYRKVAETLGVTQAHLKKLRAQFRRIDFDGYGDITVLELFEHLDEPYTPIMGRLYEQLIRGQTNSKRGDVPTLNFDNYVFFVLVFGIFTERDILKFVFETFDIDGSGHLEEEEIRALLAVVNNDTPSFPGNYNKMMREFDTDGDNRLSFKEFAGLNKKFPSAMFPVFRLHDMVHRRTLGSDIFTQLYANTAGIREAITNKKNLVKQAAAAKEEEEEELEEQKRQLAEGVGLGITGAGVGLSVTAKMGRSRDGK